MKKYKYIFLATIIITSFILSCDCAFSYKFKIKNENSEKIKHDFEINGQQKHLVIEPNKEINIAVTEGKLCSCTDCVGTRVSSKDSTLRLKNIRIYKNDTIETKTDFNNEFNWEFESKENLGVYLARIDSTDF